MYLRHTIRKKDGKAHCSWRLVRSVRVGRRVIQQTVAHLGELDEHGRIEARALARHLIGAPEQAQLFDDGSRDVTVPVRLKGIRIERSRQFGDVYLALALWRGVGLAELCAELLPAGKERVAWEKIAAVLVAARLCAPSSELHIAEDWYRRTALADLLQLDDALLNKDRLYRALDRLLVHKAAIEAHLSRRAGELFALDNEVLLYDVTSTYFEGEAELNPLAQRGYSRDHRGDRKQVLIALVVTFDGFPLGYEVFAGNMHDSKTLQTIVAAMEARHGTMGRVWIADRGMASRENLVAALDRPALHHRRAEVGAEEVRRRARGRSRLAPGARWRRGQARALPGDRGDRDPMPLGRPGQQRAGHARQVQRADRSGTGTPGDPHRPLQETPFRRADQPADRPHPATKPARRSALQGAPSRGRWPGGLASRGRSGRSLRRLGRPVGGGLSLALQHHRLER